MAFGQQAGPPATHKQVQTLLDLLVAAGHVDFRDARGPMGFTQRQAGGKFTREEADAFIARLEAERDGGDPPSPSPHRVTASERAVRALDSAVLAAELQRRGWVVMEP